MEEEDEVRERGREGKRSNKWRVMLKTIKAGKKEVKLGTCVLKYSYHCLFPFALSLNSSIFPFYASPVRLCLPRGY